MSSNATVTDTYFWRVLDGLPDNDLVLDMVLGIVLSVFTVILAGTSVQLLRLVLIERSGEKDSLSSAHIASAKGRSRRTSISSTASLVMFFLFLAATIVYWTKAFLSMKEMLCLLERLPFNRDLAGIALQDDSEERRLVVSGCRTAFWKGRIINDLDNALCLTFAILAQLFLFIADGLLVYRCYQVFVKMRYVYVPVMVIYVVYFGASILQLYPPMKAPDQVVYLKSGPFYAVWLATSITINIVVTAAIAARILMVRRKCAKVGISVLGGRDLSTPQDSVCKKIAILLVESALFPAIFGIAMTVAYYAPPVTPRSNTITFRIFDFLWLGTSVLAPQLIAIQTLQRRVAAQGYPGFSSNSVRDDDSRLRALEFNKSQTDSCIPNRTTMGNGGVDTSLLSAADHTV